MALSKRFNFLYYVLIIGGVVLFIITWEYIRDYYRTAEVETNAAVLTMSAYELSQMIENDPKFSEKYVDKYIQIEGVFLNILHGGGPNLLFTSGYQTDSSYMVGQPVLWDKLLSSNTLSTCDSFLLDYGKLYNIKEAPVKIRFTGDIINDSDSLTNFKYYGKCMEGGKHPSYYLENFCLEKIVVKAQIYGVTKTEEGYRVGLNNILILSKTPIKKKVF